MRRSWRSSIVLAMAVCGWPQAPTTATIAGTVTNALNGEPIGKAHVTLAGDTTGRFGAISTADGKYSIANLPPGFYTASVERTGWLQAVGAAGSTVEFLQVKAEPVMLHLQLTPQAVITGRVVNAKGEPVENARVTAARGSGSRSAETNHKGEFRIAGLRAGRYLLRATPNEANAPPEIRTDGTEEVYYGPAEAPSAVVTHAGAETSGIEIRLTAAKIVRVSGTVLGMPAGAKDYVLERDYGPDFHESTTTSMLTGSRFVIWRLTPDMYRLSVYCRTPGGSVHSAPVDIELGQSNIDGLELAFVPPFELKGQVGGELPPANGGPPRAIVLRAVGPRGERLPAAEIGLDGTFRVARIQPDRYRLMVARLPGNWYVKEPAGILDLTRGAPGAGIKVVLGTASGNISGTLEDGKGVVAHAMVGLTPDEPYGGDLFRAIETSAEGKYIFPNTPPGKYRVFVFDRVDFESLRSGSAAAWYLKDAEQLELGEGEAVTRNLKLPVWDNR